MARKDCTCIEGKLLPAIPIKGKNIDDYPDCPHCGGIGIVSVDPEWVVEGNYFKERRREYRVSLRKFCQMYDLDPVKVSRVERGLEPVDSKINDAYGMLILKNI